MSLNLHPDNHLPSFKHPDYALFEQGDCVHNAFTVYYARIFQSFDDAELCTMPTPGNALNMLRTADGWPVRGPNPYYWYGRPNRASRDSITPMLCFVTAGYTTYKVFRELRKTLSTKYYLLANNTKPNHRYDTPEEQAERSTPDVPFEPQSKFPDVLGPDIWAILIRGHMRHESGSLLWYLPLFVLDLHGLGASILQYFWPATDIRNQVLKAHLAAHIWATPISRLSWLIFRKSNPIATITAWCSKVGEPSWDRFLAPLLK